MGAAGWRNALAGDDRTDLPGGTPAHDGHAVSYRGPGSLTSPPNHGMGESLLIWNHGFSIVAQPTVAREKAARIAIAN